MVYTNKKILFFGILLVSVLFLSSCTQEPKAANIVQNECISCVSDGRDYCTKDVDLEGYSMGQCGVAKEDSFGIGITFGEGCSQAGGKLALVKEQCPGYVVEEPTPIDTPLSENERNGPFDVDKANIIAGFVDVGKSLDEVSVVSVSSDGTKCTLSYKGKTFTIDKGADKSLLEVDERHFLAVWVKDIVVSGIAGQESGCDLEIAVPKTTSKYDCSIQQFSSTSMRDGNAVCANFGGTKTCLFGMVSTIAYFNQTIDNFGSAQWLTMTPEMFACDENIQTLKAVELRGRDNADLGIKSIDTQIQIMCCN
ncbi:hypothetical protein J4405_01465 [Candidatus Woesearchaeota archaeon]|nr:hypothetical protein [Candidatus Woesearchaeota archaeon]